MLQVLTTRQPDFFNLPDDFSEATAVAVRAKWNEIMKRQH